MGGEPSRGRLLVADDDERARRATASALTAAGFEVTAVSDGQDATEAIFGGNFEASLLDIGMPGNEQLELVSLIAERCPLLPVVILTGRPSLETAAAALRCGAADYLTKPAAPEQLARCLDAAVRRHRTVRALRQASQLAADLANVLRAAEQALCRSSGTTYSSARPAAPAAAAEASSDLKALTSREREVVERLAAGRSAREVALELDLSENTVRNHIRNVFAKLGVHSQVALLAKLGGGSALPRRPEA